MTNKSIIWITGASSGIGKSLCLHYSQLGWKVIASSRNEKKLSESFQHCSNIDCMPCDVSDENSMRSVAGKILQDYGYISHLIVNAGNCEYVDEIPIDSSMAQRLFSVNTLGAIHSVNASLQLFQQCQSNTGKKPHIIAISSQVIFAPFTRAELYGASKAAMDYLMQSWRLDLAVYNIDMTIVYPGFVDTPLTQKNSFDMPFLQTPEQAVKAIHKAVRRRPRTLIFPKSLYACLLFSRVFPKLWQSIMLKGQRAEMQLAAPSSNISAPHQSHSVSSIHGVDRP